MATGMSYVVPLGTYFQFYLGGTLDSNREEIGAINADSISYSSSRDLLYFIIWQN